MKTRTIIAAALLGSVSLAGGIAATASSDTGAERRAASQAQAAQKALDRHRAGKAVEAAEAAVALDPRNAGYRTLLGQAYLASGRFNSAVAALTDALSLDPDSGGAALHLALAQIATGDWGAARTTLNAHDAAIPVSDRGLALALAGDPVTAVALLTDAARTPGADAKTRQNLALSLALAGRWQEAKAIASFDMSPADVDARIMQWATFSQPKGAADQVAALLGVVPVADPGQPVRLALNTTTPTYLAAAPVAAPVVAPAAEPIVDPAVAAGTVDVANIGPSVVFAPRREIVQAIPSPIAAPRVVPGRVQRVLPLAAVAVADKPASVGAFVPRPLAKGNFHVQLGAYESAGVAKDAWGRISRRIGAVGAYKPYGMRINAGGQDFYRLSVGGFARGDADALCRRVRASGNACFVRVGAGDQVAAWAAGVQLASR
ncbi:SPOR domain-containing protein [Sphingomonas sp.]|uniref:SPOR domain-containing protein n=1 Tax=Sphingomonas sp. TaxID=28214 RepID=UPI002DD62B62|nr:tetratricopeptide repeat protein [Sphingomonas sp.]